MENRLKTLLCDLGISDERSIREFYPRVRDREDISVLRCERSEVILLSRSDHAEISHYETKRGFEYWGAADRTAAVRAGLEDAQRRYEQHKTILANKRWIDVGAGAGAALDLMAPLASKTVAVEPQEDARRALVDAGYEVYASLQEVPQGGYEAATLFHVFEHLPDPIATLQTLRSKMSPGAVLIIEVPHARDFLLSFFDLEAFKAFTFWSEHLILHTRDSLRLFLEAAGFSDVSIHGCQRYPLANHLHWLTKGKPGGHVQWSFLRTRELDVAYGDMLAARDSTDTLVAFASNSARA